MDDQDTFSEPVVEPSSPAPESAPTPVEPESPKNTPTPLPVEDQNGGANQPESDAPESSNESAISESILAETVPSPSLAPAALTPQVPQPQSPAQQDQTGFIRALLAKAQAKIQSNKQKKLDKIILFAQKKKIVANEDIQKLLHVSSATATRYLVKLVQQGRLTRIGNPRDAKYQFVR